MVRVAYALGGLGSGICKNVQELEELCGKVSFENRLTQKAIHRLKLVLFAQKGFHSGTSSLG